MSASATAEATLINSAIQLNCRTVVHVLCDFLDGQIDSRFSHVVEKHLVGCPLCRQVLESARQTLTQIS
jgi:predicted anti-sigma-YlaC factor YlaD